MFDPYVFGPYGSCCAGFRIRIRILFRIQIGDPDPDPGVKNKHKKKKKQYFHFGSAGGSLLRAEGFSCSFCTLWMPLDKSIAIFD